MQPHEGIEKIFCWLTEGDCVPKVGKALRDAIDYVLDGPHTGRYDISQLDKIEKTFIGLKAEHFILHELGLEHTGVRGRLDTIIEKVAIDIKFSLTRKWMIPREAVGEVCLLASANDLISDLLPENWST